MEVSKSRKPPPIAPRSVPDERLAAEETVRPFRDMTPDQRLRAQAELVRALLAFAGDRPVLRDDDYDPLWPRWKDPLLGGRTG